MLAKGPSGYPGLFTKILHRQANRANVSGIKTRGKLKKNYIKELRKRKTF